MPNRDGTGPRWAQRPAAANADNASATPVAAGLEPPLRSGCRGQGGGGRGLGRGSRGRGSGCVQRRWGN